MPPRQKNVEDQHDPVYLYIEPTAVTGRNASRTTAAGVEGIVKQAWYLVLTVVAVHGAFYIFRWRCYHLRSKILALPLPQNESGMIGALTLLKGVPKINRCPYP